MTDQPVYLRAHPVVKDPAEFRLYEKGFFPLLKRHGGEFVTYDDAPLPPGGPSPRPGRMITFSFLSEVDAKRWYADADCRAISKHRRAARQLEFLTMEHSSPPRPAS